MALDNLSDLTTYSKRGFGVGYPSSEHLTFYAPDDDIHTALKVLLNSATQSLVVAMYGFDDEDLALIIRRKLEDEHIYVSLTLDSTQAAGKHEKAILDAMNYPTNSIAIGRSEEHAIMHLKMAVIDGLDVVNGSTNWSASGETKQDNSLTVERHPLIAHQARTKIDKVHEAILTAQHGN